MGLAKLCATYNVYWFTLCHPKIEICFSCNPSDEFFDKLVNVWRGRLAPQRDLSTAGRLHRQTDVSRQHQWIRDYLARFPRPFLWWKSLTEKALLCILGWIRFCMCQQSIWAPDFSSAHLFKPPEYSTCAIVLVKQLYCNDSCKNLDRNKR